jgi:hypothetical protein
MRLLLCFLFFIFADLASAQNWNKNLQLLVKVKEINSEYLIIPQLKLLYDSQNVQIHKKLTYDNEIDRTADCNFFLQKIIGRSYVNMYMSAYKQPITNDDNFVLKKFKVFDTLKDTINLKEYIPLEKGEYRIFITLNYYLEGIKYQINSDWFNFKVLFKPKNQLFY